MYSFSAFYLVARSIGNSLFEATSWQLKLALYSETEVFRRCSGEARPCKVLLACPKKGVPNSRRETRLRVSITHPLLMPHGSDVIGGQNWKCAQDWVGKQDTAIESPGFVDHLATDWFCEALWPKIFGTWRGIALGRHGWEGLGNRGVVKGGYQRIPAFSFLQRIAPSNQYWMGIKMDRCSTMQY